MADDGWIEWKGGECPVDPDTNVLVRFADGYEETDEFDGATPAGYWVWHHKGYESDIIAYRIVEQ